MKRIQSIVWLLLCMLILCACQNEGEKTPAETVEAFMKALSAMDTESVDSLYAEALPMDTLLGSEKEKILVSAVFSKLQWEIGEQFVEEDLARVHVKITAAPYHEMVQAYETHVKENLESYRAQYSDMDDETYQAAILEDRVDFYKAYTKRITTEVDMDLVCQEGQWIISHCEGLSEAILGENNS